MLDRPTPNCRISSCSEGNRSPGRSRPSLMRLAISATTRSLNVTLFWFGRPMRIPPFVPQIYHSGEISSHHKDRKQVLKCARTSLNCRDLHVDTLDDMLIV